MQPAMACYPLLVGSELLPMLSDMAVHCLNSRQDVFLSPHAAGQIVYLGTEIQERVSV
jgi:hypothetical protein